MRIDETITKVFEQIKVEVKEKFDVDISTKELYDIVRTQLDATRLGFSKLVSVHWLNWGKFIFVDKYNRKNKVFELSKQIDNPDYILTEEERVNLKKELIVESGEKRKELLHINKNTKTISVDDLMSIETHLKPKLPMFKNLMKKR